MEAGGNPRGRYALGHFAASVTEAKHWRGLADFDFLQHIGESYATYALGSQFLGVTQIAGCARAKGVLDAIDMLRGMNSDSARKVPADAPTGIH
nr:hypothetical protein [Escherichia coli]